MQEPGALLAIERQKIIREVLEREGVVRNADLRKRLKVSTVTVRADLRTLARQGICDLIWGGAVYKNTPAEPDLSKPPLSPQSISPNGAEVANREAKQRIGARAAQLVKSGQTIIVDSGSTTVELLQHLPTDLDYLRIVTQALNIAAAAAHFPQVELVMTGGVLRNRTYSLIGPQAIHSLEMFNADWAFLSTSAFNIEQGITTSNILEAELKKTMIVHAERVVLLADHSKFGSAHALTVAPLTGIDMLITDSGLSDEAAAQISATGIEVIRV
jgi:DeoR/GlpR family transcriptional regulator of sugar metabolism